MKEDREEFRPLLSEGELNIDPENLSKDLDEDELAISRLQLWLDIDKSGIENIDSPSIPDTDSESDPGSIYESPETDRDYLNINQLSEYLGISTSTIYSMG